jgi:hypothetical protein
MHRYACLVPDACTHYQDNQELAFLLSNVCVMLHLIRKELQGISTPSKRLKRYRALPSHLVYFMSTLPLLLTSRSPPD